MIGVSMCDKSAAVPTMASLFTSYSARLMCLDESRGNKKEAFDFNKSDKDWPIPPAAPRTAILRISRCWTSYDTAGIFESVADTVPRLLNILVVD